MGTRRNGSGLCILLFFLFARVAGAASPDSAPYNKKYLPLLSMAQELGILHSTLEARTRQIAVLSVALAANPTEASPEKSTQIGDLIQFGLTLPDVLLHLNQEMFEMHQVLLQNGIDAFDIKFNVWKMVYDAAINDAYELQEGVGGLKGNLSAREAGANLRNSAKLMQALSALTTKLHTSFQSIANLLEIFSQSNFKPAAPNRILGENWLQHEKRTGEWGIADPKRPTKVFRSHSIFAIRDQNPKHDVWACEATIKDFLDGRVKGQDHPYQNIASIPFCYRCHSKRDGYHNFPWCIYDNSGELIRACKIIEETGTSRQGGRE